MTGTLTDLSDDAIIQVGYSRIGPRQQLRGWLDLLALTVAHPGRPWRLLLIGRGPSTRLGPVPASFARMVLDDLVQLWRTGMAGPIPFAANASASYARTLTTAGEDEAIRAARERWSWDADPIYRLFYGDGLADLLREPSRADEERGSSVSRHRFGTLAQRVFTPLFGALS